MRTVRAVLTVKRAVYLLLSLGLGTTWFVILVVGLSTGIGLLITLLGIPILIGVLYATRPMADLERALVHGLLDERAEGHYRRPARDGIWSSLRARVADPQTWKDIAYLACQFPLGIIWFTAHVDRDRPAARRYCSHPCGTGCAGRDRRRCSGTSTACREARFLVPIGALLVVPARYLVDGMGIAHGYWARLLLHSEPDPELTAKVVDARSAQARIIAAADAERRRIERDLHDGAQQRLVALSLKLGMARKRLGDDATAWRCSSSTRRRRSPAPRSRSCATSPAASTPPSSPTAGWPPRCASSRRGRPVPTEIVEAPEARLLPAVEGTAVLRRRRVPHEHRQVREGRRRRPSACAPEVGRLVVEVVDDGIGGADAERGSGLRGLADRVGALDGSLEVASPQGHGTRVRAEIPLVGG